MKRRKLFAFVLSVTLSSVILSGCGRDKKPDVKIDDDTKQETVTDDDTETEGNRKTEKDQKQVDK